VVRRDRVSIVVGRCRHNRGGADATNHVAVSSSDGAKLK
jgi:hypothetical protein